VAIFRMQISSVGRSAGRRATAAAAYRAGERLRDERSGRLYNYSRRQDVLHTDIFLPAQIEGVAAVWAANREKLWNTAEHAEKRHNSRVAREYQMALPRELSPAQRIALARAFSREIAERYKVAVDLAVHEPRPDGDPSNFHAHLLTTTREVTPTGLGAKTGLDMNTRERHRRQLPDVRQEFVTLRERWATLTNQALKEAHVEARIDHRSLAAQGIDREPLSIPLVSLKIERRGVRSFVAERLRADYRARVQRHLERRAGKSGEQLPAPGSEQAQAQPQWRAQDTRREQSPESGAATDRPKSLEEVRREAREAWLRMRASVAERGDAARRENAQPVRESSERETSAASSAEDDLAL
jgi:ATP-dependent exoDNAse (exonuclease V) alpha subunit